MVAEPILTVTGLTAGYDATDILRGIAGVLADLRRWARRAGRTGTAAEADHA